MSTELVTLLTAVATVAANFGALRASFKHLRKDVTDFQKEIILRLQALERRASLNGTDRLRDR